MSSLFVESLFFIFSSFISLSLSFLGKDIVKSVKTLGILLLIIVIFFIPKIFFGTKNPRFKRIFRSIFLFFCSFLIQLFILTTGGVKSPLLIFLHIFTLAVSFLVSLPSALVFLTSSFTVILFVAWIDKNSVLYSDPSSFYLYLVSFVVVIPISIVISRFYYLKDSILSILKKEIKFKEEEHTTLIEGLSELIFVTDIQLQIISLNPIVETILAFTKSEMIGHPFFDMVLLKDEGGNLITNKSISIEEIINQRKPFELKGLILFASHALRSFKVDLLVKPSPNLEGRIDKLLFILSPENLTTSSSKPHLKLEEARVRHEALVDEYKKKLITSQLTKDVSVEAQLLLKGEQDIVNSLEIEDHSIQEETQAIDLARLCKDTVEKEKEFARTFKVDLDFGIDNFGQEDLNRIIPAGITVNPLDNTGPFFTANLNIKIFSVLIEKLVDIAILVSFDGQNNKKVALKLDRESEIAIIIKIKIERLISDVEKKMIFTEYYGTLGDTTGLKYGSGLEGYLAKMISLHMNIPLSIETSQTETIFTLWIRKQKLPLDRA